MNLNVKNFLKMTAFVLGFVFLIALPCVVGYFIGNYHLFWGSVVIAAYCVALVTVATTRFWRSILIDAILINAIFILICIACGIIGWHLVLPKFFPDIFDFLEVYPYAIRNMVIAVATLYALSTFMFLRIYHFGRQRIIRST
jgi:hypothetical protein